MFPAPATPRANRIPNCSFMETHEVKSPMDTLAKEGIRKFNESVEVAFRYQDAAAMASLCELSLFAAWSHCRVLNDFFSRASAISASI